MSFRIQNILPKHSFKGRDLLFTKTTYYLEGGNSVAQEASRIQRLCLLSTLLAFVLRYFYYSLNKYSIRKLEGKGGRTQPSKNDTAIGHDINRLGPTRSKMAEDSTSDVKPQYMLTVMH